MKHISFVMVLLSILETCAAPAQSQKKQPKDYLYNMEVTQEVKAAPEEVAGAVSQNNGVPEVVSALQPDEAAKFIVETPVHEPQEETKPSVGKQQKIIKPSPKTQPARRNAQNQTVPKKAEKKDTIAQDAASSAPKSAYMESSVVPEFKDKEFAEQRRKAAVALVEKGAAYLKLHPENEALSAFTFNKEFIDGEIYLFVYSLEGVCLAQGLQEYLIWKNHWNLKDKFGNYIVRIIIDSARKSAGWVTYQWQNSTKLTYVQEVVKEGQVYIIGAGFYPHSKRDSVVGLVRAAVELFNESVRAGKDIQEAFGRISYPLGNFVYGDLYIFSLDFQGNMMAQGDRPGLIGQNSIDYRDTDGRYINREIIEKLQKTTEGVWVEYKSKRARKIVYTEKVTDDKGKNYFIACGYYPESGRAEVVDLVRQGYVYMEGHGKSQAAEEFNSKVSNTFRYGDLFIMVYDMTGKCIAHGGNADLIGSSQWDVQDEDSKYVVRAMIQKGKEGGGWLDFMLKNAFWFVYTEMVSLGQDNYIIASGLYPISKPETMQLLIKSAIGSLGSNPRYIAFGQMTARNGRFVRGDMDVFVFDDKGICYVFGDDHSRVWKQMFNAKDDDGREYVKLFINTAKKGGGRVMFTERGKSKVAYVEPLEKNGVFYVVGSSFFL